MIRSMTGYGRGECIRGDWKCYVEVKAVNHRFCDVSIRLPSMMNPYEDRIRKLIAKEVNRGKVDVYVRIDSLGQQPVNIDVNLAVADAYSEALNKLKARFTVPDQVTLEMLASRPDVFMVDKSVTDDQRNQVWSPLEEALNIAVSQFNEMRALEGKTLYGDMMARRLRMIDCLGKVKERIPIAALEYKKRLEERIADVLANMPDTEPDESRMMLELALYADRICIDEEITRLESHLSQFDSILTESDTVGRKLDFLVQELHREVNTIGSKSGDIELSRFVIDMKSEIEKIREQVQNVE